MFYQLKRSLYNKNKKAEEIVSANAQLTVSHFMWFL